MSAQRLNLLKAIAAACRSARPTVRNTSESYGSLVLKTTIKDANESRCEKMMAELGFVRTSIKADGGNGDFSSNIYGSNYVHPSGVKVSVYTTFYTIGTFYISIACWQDGAIAGY